MERVFEKRYFSTVSHTYCLKEAYLISIKVFHYLFFEIFFPVVSLQKRNFCLWSCRLPSHASISFIFFYLFSHRTSNEPYSLHFLYVEHGATKTHDIIAFMHRSVPLCTVHYAQGCINHRCINSFNSLSTVLLSR
jgi:hypothetical protein